MAEIDTYVPNGLTKDIDVDYKATNKPTQCRNGDSRDQSAVRVSFSEEVKRRVIPNSQKTFALSRNSSGDLHQGFYDGKQSSLEKYTSRRWIVTYICFLAITLSVLLRQCMSMALVCMELHFEQSIDISTPNHTSYNQSNSSTSLLKKNKWLINWDGDEQGLVIQSYYYGFPLTPFLGGYLAGRFSGKMVVISSTIVLIMTSLAIPYAATISPYFVVGLRCIVGISTGSLQPSIAPILSQWAPLSERAQIVSFANTGMMIGTMSQFIFSGMICSIPQQEGWPFIFYIFGVCNMIGLVMWIYLVYDTPYEHPSINMKEIIRIARNRRDSTIEKMPSPPWKSILTSGPLWGLLFAHGAHGLLMATIGTYLPIYMNDVLGFDITSNGLLSSLPFLGRFLGSILAGYVADKLYVKHMLTATTIRKLFQFIGNFFSAPFLIALTLMDESRREIAVVLIVCYWTVMAINNAAFRVNHLDIAPRFAGVLNGISTTFASVMALVSPVMVSALTKNRTKEEWSVVFYICIAVAVVGALGFVILGDAKEQDWAKDETMNYDTAVTVEQNTNQEESDNDSITYITNIAEPAQDVSYAVDDTESENNNTVHEVYGGVVNEGFDTKEENDLKEIISYVKLSSSFRNSNPEIQTNGDLFSNRKASVFYSGDRSLNTPAIDMSESSSDKSINGNAREGVNTSLDRKEEKEGESSPPVPNGDIILEDQPKLNKFRNRTKEFRNNNKLHIPKID